MNSSTTAIPFFNASRCFCSFCKTTLLGGLSCCGCPARGDLLLLQGGLTLLLLNLLLLKLLTLADGSRAALCQD